MTLFQRAKELVSSRAWAGTAVWIPDAQVYPRPVPAPPPITADATYIRLWLSGARLEYSKQWFVEWHPAVHAVVSRNFGNSSEEEVAVISPAGIPGFSAAAQAAVLLDKALTPLLPFPGGTVSINAGLVAVKGESLVRKIIDVVGGFGNLIPSAPLAAGKNIASAVVDGFETLLGISGDVGTLSFDGTLAVGGGGAVHSLAPGYLAVMTQAPATDTLWVRDGHLISWSGGARYDEIAGSHLLFRLESRTERDDWRYLTDIAGPVDAALRAENPDTRTARFQQAIIAARTSPDLHEADRIRVASALRDLRDTNRGLGAVAGLGPTNLADVVEQSMMSAADALEYRPSLGQLLA